MALLSRRYWCLKLIVLLMVSLGVAAAVLPWKRWLETELIAALAHKGIAPVTLSIAHVGLTGITLENIRLGSGDPLELKQLTLGYSLSELAHRSINSLDLRGVRLVAQHTASGWRIAGMDGMSKPASTPNAMQLPVNRAALAVLPFRTLTLADSSISLADGTLRGTVPLDITWQSTPMPRVTYAAKGLAFASGGMQMTTGGASLTAELNEKEARWEGRWQLGTLALIGTPIAFPVLDAEGIFTAGPERLQLSGKIASADKAYHIVFHLDDALNNPARSFLTIESARIPWNGGLIATRNVKIALAGGKPIAVPITIEHVSLAVLMDVLTAGKATGTGTVSGSVPLTILPDGAVTFGAGTLVAEAPGVIALSPEVIPGDNAQVAVVRDILKNLHYSLLSIAMQSSKDKTLTLGMLVEGKNPDLANARPVRLHVQLTGDLLKLMTASVMTLTNPKQFLQQEPNEN